MERRIGSKRIETPNIFASYRIKDFPRAGLQSHPWKMTNTQGLLLNAFDLLANKRTAQFTPEIHERPGKLHEFVEFDGPIMLDSGAFNFLQHPEITITSSEVLKIGLALRADVSVVLDHPFPPKSTAQEIKSRWDNTLENTKRMFEELSIQDGEIPPNFELMPVIHGHDADTLKRTLDDVVSITQKQPELVGIGSLAPLARNGSKRTVIEVLLAARQLLPDAHIHCFSLGSALLMLFAFYCGADTVDSQTWLMTAAYKNVQLPGFHQTRISQQEARKAPEQYENNRRQFTSQLLRLADKEKFEVQDWESGAPWPINNQNDALAYWDYLEEKDGVNLLHRRACHNLYTFNFEARRVRQEMEQGNLEDFILSRMKSTVYKNAFAYAVEQRQKMGGTLV